MKIDLDGLFEEWVQKEAGKNFLMLEKEQADWGAVRLGNLSDVIPDYLHGQTGNVLEANIQYKNEKLEVALYESDEEVKKNLIYPIVLSRTQTTKAHFTKRSGWQCYQLIYTNAGSAVVNLENRIYNLTPGSLFLLDCRPHHYFYANDPEGWDYSFIHFDGGNSGYFYSLMENALLYENMSASRAYRIFERILFASRGDSEDFEILFHVWMTELLMSLYLENARVGAHRNAPRWIAEVQTYIEEHSAENLQVRELARMSFLSPGRFAHLFTEIVGVSPIEYQHRIRIRKAMDLLENTREALSDVGSRIGYHSAAGFYAVFRRMTGMTPGEYRKKNLQMDF